ncbi:MAG: hypothetical protein RL240_4450 [Planctomycetota bacterium]
MRDSRFETLKSDGGIRFSSLPAKVPSKLHRLSWSFMSRAVVNWRRDFPSVSLFDKQVNNARGREGS